MSPRSIAPRVALGLLALAVLSACKADDLNIVVLSARAPGGNCDFSDDTKYVSRGSLDLTPYAVGTGTAVTDQYYQVFSWQSNLTSTPILVNGQTVDPGTGNDFIADTVVYSYQYSDPSVTLANETQNIRAIITAGGAAKDNSVPAELIQPKAFAAIDASTAIDTSAQTLLVTFQYFGKLAAGGSKNTNKVSFPVTIYRRSNTAVTCPSGQIINGGVCGIPGRDQDVGCKLP